ncbi:MAG: DUF503 domain-containing protein [Anaerovoracaceae bacterium]|jgi:uncharacterized protein YlxP (DUF503 family)|nr:DUF503 domain-containing protein [Clostridiales bacterium]
MIVGKIKIKIHIPWSHSLKEKRMVVKSICAKIRNRFNVSIAEVEEQDTHKIIVLGVSYVTTDNAQADSIADHVVNFIESNTEGDIFNIEREIV